MLRDLSTRPEAVQNVVSTIFEAPDLTLTGGVQEIPDAGGKIRYVWTGRATLDGAPSRIVFAIWGCKESDRTFIGYYAGPTETRSDPVRVLMTARCP